MIKRAPSRGYFGGVCQGLAEQTDTNPLAWRIIFLLAPSSLWVYIALWILLKKEDEQYN